MCVTSKQPKSLYRVWKPKRALPPEKAAPQARECALVYIDLRIETDAPYPIRSPTMMRPVITISHDGVDRPRMRALTRRCSNLA